MYIPFWIIFLQLWFFGPFKDRSIINVFNPWFPCSNSRVLIHHKLMPSLYIVFSLQQTFLATPTPFKSISLSANRNGITNKKLHVWPNEHLFVSFPIRDCVCLYVLLLMPLVYEYMEQLCLAGIVALAVEYLQGTKGFNGEMVLVCFILWIRYILGRV